MAALPFALLPLPLGTITTGNERTEKPASHLGELDAIGMTWKSNGNSNLWARGDLGAAKDIDFASLIHANAQAGTTIRLRLGDSQNDVDGVSLLSQPNDFDNAYWAKTNTSVTADTSVAPDGTTTADTLVSTISGGANTCYVEKVQTVSSGLTYTFALYVKQGTSPTSLLNFFRVTPFSQALALITWGTTPSMVASGADLLGSGFEAVGNGWYRVWLTMSSGTATAMACRLYVRGQGTDNVSGETTLLWGAELRQAAQPAYDSLPQLLVNPAITRAEGLYSSHLEMPSIQNRRWWRIDIGNHSGDFEAANLVLGKRLTPATYYSSGFQFGSQDLGALQMTKWGIADIEDGLIFRTVDFTLGWLSEADFESKFRPLVDTVGKRRLVFWCHDPTANAYRQLKSYLGWLKEPRPVIVGQNAVGKHSLDISLVSMI